MANKYVTANNKLVVVDGKLLQISGDSVDDELLNLIDTQTTSLGTTELSVSEIDTLIDNHIVDGVTLDSSVLLIDSPSNNEVSIKDIRVSNIDVAFITLNTTNGYVDLYGSGNNVNLYADTTLNYESGNITTDNLVAENIKKDVNILGVVGTHEGGGSLNVAYSLTPPSDKTKIWLECEEPQAVEVQNYIGNVNLSEVANYGAIDIPTSDTSYFYSGWFNTCYIGNNQIAIVGYNHIRIYDLTSKSYIADYTISVGTSNYYTNVLYKDKFLYFGYNGNLYSYDLSTQTLTTLKTYSDRMYLYIFFNGENEIDAIVYYDSNRVGYRYRYNLTDNTNTNIARFSAYDSISSLNGTCSIKVGNAIYNFKYSRDYSYMYFKIDLLANTITTLSSFADFVKNTFASDYFTNISVIADSEERYVYLIGGGWSTIGFNHIIKYDTVNDSFEKLGIPLLGDRNDSFSLLIDNRVYIFGGNVVRKNQIDYFDLKYDLQQNNAIITTNTINTDNALPLINTEKLKLNSNIASAYKGNAENLAEKVNCYYWDGSKWVAINRTDYFEWFTIPNQATQVHNNITIDLTKYYITDKEPTLSVSVAGGGISANITDDKLLSITINEAISTTTIIVTATINGFTYNTQFSVEAIASA